MPSTTPMTHRQILEAMAGLLVGLFVVMLSSTIVSNALPRIVADLHGTESSYTWVVTATLLAMTATTPIWGKLSDLFNKQLLVQTALVVFVVGSAIAGLAQSMDQLIAARVLQGVGAGGLTALVQVCMAAMISPRERGRYSGYLGGVMALATVAGPLIGGIIVDTSWLGWRWCFYVGVPFAVVSLVVLQKTLHLPTTRRGDVSIDYLGATTITGGISALLVWVSLAGHQFAWASWQTAALVSTGVVLVLASILVETRAKEPIIPLRLFRNRTLTFAAIASGAVGVAMFGATVFLAQYFQISRGNSPTESGLLTLPMMGGMFIASTVSGRRITATGLWKRWLLAGAASLTVGFALMGTIHAHTPYWHIALFMLVLGSGLGMTMQNLVLVVQNSVAIEDLGVASSTVAFIRSMGGAIGVSTLGALLGHRVADHLERGFARLGIDAPTTTGGGPSIPDVASLPVPVRRVVEDAFGDATAHVFLTAAPFAFLALLAVCCIREVPLRMTAGTPGPDDVAHGVERTAAVATAASQGIAVEPVRT